MGEFSILGIFIVGFGYIVGRLEVRSYLYNMKKIIHNLNFYFDYYFGYFMHNANGGNKKWSDYMINKYPEKFPNEVEYLEELKKKAE